MFTLLYKLNSSLSKQSSSSFFKFKFVFFYEFGFEFASLTDWLPRDPYLIWPIIRSHIVCQKIYEKINDFVNTIFVLTYQIILW